MAHKLDIFETLAAIDRRDHNFLDNLPEEERKAFAPIVVQRWASSFARDGEASDLNLYLVNEYSNLNFFDIWEYPDLQYKILASTGLGSQSRRAWIPMTKQAKGKGSGLIDFLLRYWPDANNDELNIVLRQFDRISFEDFVNGCGLTPEETKETLNAYDSYYGLSKPKKSSKKVKGR